MNDTADFRTRADLRADLERLGVAPGDTVMAHAALSRVGRLLNGPDALIGALLDATAIGGTVLAYTDWDARYDELVGPDGRVAESWRPHVPPFEAAASRAARDNGALPEFLRTWPGARRSGSPGASVAALGTRADWITADHPLDYGYGEGSPLAKLVSVGGKVLMVGAPLDTMTLLHHAEHLARIPGKRVIRYEVPFATGAGGVAWRMTEEFDTADPVVADSTTTISGRSSRRSWPRSKVPRVWSVPPRACWSRPPRSPTSPWRGWKPARDELTVGAVAGRAPRRGAPR